MEKIKNLIVTILIAANAVAQQPPTPNPTSDPSLPLPGPQKGTVAWYRGGNSVAAPSGAANIFGTLWKSPIYTKTNGFTRTRLNGDLVVPILNGTFNHNTSGYFGISFNPGVASFFDTNSPWAMLHLDGPNNTPFSGDWRSWMRTGVYMRENSDAMYVGLKNEFTSSGINRSDAVINWSDDATAAGGVDKLRFLFTSTGGGNGSGTNPRSGASFAGYEFMRMQSFPGITNSVGFPVGHVGIGPLFTDLLPPQNRLHMNAEDNLANFLQISNSAGTGQTASDGLQIGYPNTTPTFLTAHINQKENDNMVMFTNNGERLRVSQIGNISVPNMNPGGIANNITRVSISHNPANPVTRPLSLLHLGYNTGQLSFPAGSTDGWRPWMDIGTFASNGTDHVYIGLKDENGPLGDRQDAILNWGDNQASGLPPGNGPDNFRFIFTSTQAASAPGSVEGKSANGLEAMRMNPTLANGVYTGIGGDPSGNPYSGGQNPNNTLEVNSWGTTPTPGGSSGLRFTNLNTTSPTLANPGLGVLSVDANGDVIYVPDGGSGAGFGNLCSATQNPLPADFEIPLNQHNYYFSGQGKAVTNIGMGLPCGTPLLFAKLQVYQSTPNNTFNPGISMAGEFDNVATGVAAFGLYSTATGPGNTNVGVYGLADNASGQNIAIYGDVGGATTGVPPISTQQNLAGYFNGDVYISGQVSPSDQNLKENIDTITNALGIIKQLKPKSFDYKHSAYPGMHLSAGKQFGLIAQEVETILPELVNNTTQPAKLDSVGNIIIPSVTFKGLEYQQLIPFLIKGMQEQQAKIDSLTKQLNAKDSIQDARLAALENAINQCCSNNSARNNNTAALNQLDIELSDKDAIVLNQNVPNPFAEQTTITYNVPASVTKAQIIFYNNAGQIIQTVDVKTRGKGKVNVFASDLSSGLYHYILVADGKVVDSKKMVRE